jgi:hypothetical protein
MIRYDPIHRFTIGGSTLGEMQAKEDGDYVFYNEAHEIELDYMDLARVCDGHTAAECILNVQEWKTQLKESKGILERSLKHIAHHLNCHARTGEGFECTCGYLQLYKDIQRALRASDDF